MSLIAAKIGEIVFPVEDPGCGSAGVYDFSTNPG
jgi:hypothetical protein